MLEHRCSSFAVGTLDARQHAQTLLNPERAQSVENSPPASITLVFKCSPFGYPSIRVKALNTLPSCRR
jgi:hypothetical protein